MALEAYQNKAPQSDNDLLKELLGSEEELNASKGLFQNQDMVKLVQTYLEEDIPPEILNKKVMREMWAVMGKTIKLSFVDKEDLFDYEILFDQARINYIMGIPPYEFTFEDQQLLDQLKIYYISAVKRAVGFAGHRFNERIILGGTINQTIRSNTESFNSGNNGGGGFLSKLKRIF